MVWQPIGCVNTCSTMTRADGRAHRPGADSVAREAGLKSRNTRLQAVMRQARLLGRVGSDRAAHGELFSQCGIEGGTELVVSLGSEAIEDSGEEAACRNREDDIGYVSGGQALLA